MPERTPTSVDTGGIVVAASALVVVVGAFLGWYTVPVAGTLGSIEGIDLFEFGTPAFNGVATVSLASVVTVLALFLSDTDAANVLTAIGGLAIELVAAAFVLTPEIALGSALYASGDTLTNVGVGVYVTLVGGVGVLLGAVMSYRR